jgi:hypothetical protein
MLLAVIGGIMRRVLLILTDRVERSSRLGQPRWHLRLMRCYIVARVGRVCRKSTKVLSGFRSCGCVILCVLSFVSLSSALSLPAIMCHVVLAYHAPPAPALPGAQAPRHVLGIRSHVTYRIHHKLETCRTQTLTARRFLGRPGPAARFLDKADSFQREMLVFRNPHLLRRRIYCRAVRPVDTSVSCVPGAECHDRRPTNHMPLFRSELGAMLELTRTW